jgi:hypothetical protein
MEKLTHKRLLEMGDVDKIVLVLNLRPIRAVPII